MPRRNKSGAATIGGEEQNLAPVVPDPQTTKPEFSPVGDTEVEQLAHMAAVYVAMHEKAKEFEEEKKKQGVQIKALLDAHPELLSQVGAHRETTVNFSGLEEFLIRLQVSSSVSYTDDAIQSLRNKVGANVDRFIIVREELADGALAILLQEGFITPADVQALTVETRKEALYVKSLDNKAKKPARKK